MKKVFIVTHYDIYDNDHTQFVIGVGSTQEEAVNIIKDEIKNVAYAYSCYRYEIDQWQLNARYMGGLTQSFSKEQNIQFAKELGVYDGNNNFMKSLLLNISIDMLTV